MQILSRRLYNGGFNHLKSAASCLYRASSIVNGPPLSRQFCVAKMPDFNNSSADEEGIYTSARDAGVSWHPTVSPEMSAHLDFVSSNEKYAAEYGDKGTLATAPAKKLAIVTCMDARLNVFGHLGLKEGDAHVIRNAGGVAKDALRSIIISQRLLGTREIAVFHHTACGMLTFSTPQLRTLVKDSDPQNADLSVVDSIDFLEFGDVEKSVRSDVKFLKENPLVLPETKITGWVFEVETGKVKQIV
ncbi:hypothetical protein AcW1_007972 [Taiwanofungus camphoratus]|nr:hypothetical protein AcV5_008263 [Antrodia cinnamomea]KAI0950741.1 hypothetical protein AcW1_007972 [Antrodia cinnamomea]KAI0955650.1 hypothetical protein AcV7_006260 [Antrodia cinnamomea]